MAEKEYIERGEIVRHIRSIYDELSNAYVSPNGGSAAEREKASLNGGLTVALVVETAAKAIPAADVVEVVRCKDCKHYKEYLDISTKEPTGWGKCTSIAMDIDLTRNDFCSYGERKKQK